jgi:hypothetical protein
MLVQCGILERPVLSGGSVKNTVSSVGFAASTFEHAELKVCLHNSEC